MNRKKIDFEIPGGTKVQYGNTKIKIPKIFGLALLLMLFGVTSAFAQGSIFGTVSNSDLSTPANGELTFFGYLDDTDEEIRIETSVGAGYDAGNWFDDFQNYLTEAPGNPYDYHFYNTTNGEGFVLSKLIPNNSFQQENIVLEPVSWPATPTALNGIVVSPASVLIEWTGSAGATYHVYRRLATSNGSFFRIDDPSGSLANPGVATEYFIDNNVDGTSSYHYLVIAEDASGNLSQHSEILTVNTITAAAPIVDSISPNSGSYVGGQTVQVFGHGFDVNGASVTFGGNPATNILVVSPYEIACETPAGTAGTAVDIVVTNTFSALSGTLAGGFTYLSNTPPQLAPIGPQSADEGTTLTINVSATDPDATTPSLFTSTPLPGTATFTDNGDGTGVFEWTTTFTDAGSYQVTFYAADTEDTTSELVDITINEVGNQPPVLSAIGPQTLNETETLTINLSASDPDGEIPSLSVTDAPTAATFTDNGDGTGLFEWVTTYDDSGTYNVTFKAFDGIVVDSEVVQIDVANVNRSPVLATIDPQIVDENVNLIFTATSTDADGETPSLYAENLPATATFTDSGDGSAVFDWTPGFVDAGFYQVTVFATDNIDTVSQIVDITVNEAGNQAPVLDSIGPLTVVEGTSLAVNITATDPDAEIPQLFADSLPVNASFFDSTNGVGTFFFNPDFTQAGTYNVLFYASDGLLSDSELVEVTVTETGNQPPNLSPIADTTIIEGDSLTIVVNAADPENDGVQLLVTSTMTSYNFVDSGNGVGVFSAYADFFSAGVDSIWFTATDLAIPPAAITDTVQVTIAELNQPPVIDSIGPFGVSIDDTLRFTVTAFDSTDNDTSHTIDLTVIGLPTNATFVDDGDNTGTFTFIPVETQVGNYTVTFVATDQGSPPLTATLDVNISVVQENRPPVITVEDYYIVNEGENLTFTATATDGDGTIPVITAGHLPEGMTFVDNGDGTALFDWTPGYTEAGLWYLYVYAYDGIERVRETVIIQIYEAGNQSPIIDPISPTNVTEGDTLEITINAVDPDGTIPTLTADSLPLNASFTDNGDGTGLLDFYPEYVQAGTYDIYIIADDGELVDTLIVTIVVDDAGNQAPIMSAIDDVTTDELQTVSFTVSAVDPDSTIPILSADSLPGGAAFADNGDGTGSFSWTTDNFDAGTYNVYFIATDAVDPLLTDTAVAVITINNVNQLPRVAVEAANIDMDEGDTLNLQIFAQDPDSTIPEIVLDSGYSLIENMTFTDNGDGTGLLTFIPDYTQGNSSLGFVTYFERFAAVDSETGEWGQRSRVVNISVYHKNLAPEVTIPVTDTTITEGDTLILNITSSDFDGTTPILTADNLPDSNVTFDGTSSQKTFEFIPDFTQAGLYSVDFIATDGSLADTQTVNIEVLEAGNQAPVFINEPYSLTVVAATFDTTIVIQAYEPELEQVTITVSNVVTNAAFVDSGNGIATYYFAPSLAQVDSLYSISFIATDPSGLADTTSTTLRVVDFLRGDANSDADLNMLDIMYIINFLYKGGSAPVVVEAADSNYDLQVNLQDAIYLINFFYKGGPPPPLE